MNPHSQLKYSRFDYPCGMTMPGRNGNTSEMRYGFNGMEQDGEISGSGNSYDFGARILNPRLGRWNSVDDKAGQYYSMSPYNFGGDNPIRFMDPDGNILIIKGSRSYRKQMLAHLRAISNDKIKYNARTGVVEFIAPKDVSVPASKGTQLVRDLIQNDNSLTIENTKGLAEYMALNGGSAKMLADSPYETFALKEGTPVTPGSLIGSNTESVGYNTIVHFSHPLDDYPTHAVVDENGNISYEEAEGYIVLGHELFHALLTMEGGLTKADFREDRGKYDPDNATTNVGLGPYQSYHEWKVRRLENLLRSEHALKQRYIPEIDYNELIQMDEDADDFYDPFIDHFEEGTGITDDMDEYWVQYLRSQGVANPEQVLKDFITHHENNRKSQEKYRKKAKKEIEKGQKKAARKKARKERKRRRWFGKKAYF